MAKGIIYEYAVLYHPKEKKDTAGNVIEEKKSEVVVPVTRIVATSESEVGMLAARSVPKEYEDKIPDLQVFIRPF